MLSTAAVVGIYGAAVRVSAFGAMLFMAAQVAAGPMVSDLHHRGEAAQLGRLYQTLTRWSLAFFLPYFLAMVLYASPILALFGTEFEAGAVVLVIVSTGTLLGAATGIGNNMIVMTGHSNLAFLNTVAALILNLSLNLILIPAWGLVGAALATGFTVATVGVVRLFQVYWLQKVWPYNWEFVKPLVAGVVSAGVGLLVRHLVPAEQNLFYLLLNLGILWSAYVAITLLLGLSRDDRMILSRTKRRLSTVPSWR